MRTLAEFRDACTESPEWVLLDNMDLAGLRECVRERDCARRRDLAWEASGGVRLDTVRAVALTGVDAVSIGALTHGATWIDIALEVERRGTTISLFSPSGCACGGSAGR